MNRLAEFFTPEAGRRRRAWLDGVDERISNRLAYMLGPHLFPVAETAAQGANMLMGGADFRDAVTASGDLMGARSGSEALRAGGTLGAATLAMALPGVSNRLAQEGVSAAQDVARLLREGRAAEVTDEMMARVDPQEMYRLYESGATGVPMPMDEASRMARAREMGFDTGRPVYHGTPDNREVLARGGFEGRGSPVYTSDNRGVAASYADDRRAFDYQNADPDVFSLLRRPGRDAAIDAGGASFRGMDARAVADATGADISGLAIRSDGKVSTAELERVLRRQGFDGAEIKRVVDTYTGRGPQSAVQMTFDPTALRRTSARFDPRLSHLANLSAAGAGVATAGALATGPEDDNWARVRAYLAENGFLD